MNSNKFKIGFNIKKSKIKSFLLHDDGMYFFDVFVNNLMYEFRITRLDKTKYKVNTLEVISESIEQVVSMDEIVDFIHHHRKELYRDEFSIVLRKIGNT